MRRITKKVLYRYFFNVLLADMSIYLLTSLYCWCRYRDTLTKHQFGMSLSTISFVFLCFGIGLISVVSKSSVNLSPRDIFFGPQTKSDAERKQDAAEMPWAGRTAIVLTIASIISLASTFFFLDLQAISFD